MTRLLLRVGTVAATALSMFAAQTALVGHAVVPWTPGTIFAADQGSGTGGAYYIPPGGSPTPLQFGTITDINTDAAGNVYFTDCAGGAYEYVPGVGVHLMNTFNCPVSVTVDRSGNVLVGDFSNLYIMPPGGGAKSLLETGIVPLSSQVDAGGNLWFTDGSNHLGVMVGAVAPVTLTSGLPGASDTNALRLDSAGNMFVSTAFGDNAAEIPAGGSGAATTFGTGLGYTHGVATDGAGSVFIADVNHGIVVSVVGSTQTVIAAGFGGLQGLAIWPPVAAAVRSSSSTVLSTTSPLTVTTIVKVHLTATVSTSGSAAGLVQFSSNQLPLGNAVATSGGIATLTTPLPVGTDSVTATFLGNPTTLASEGSPLAFTVNPLGTNTTLTTSSPTTIPGDTPANLKATVAGSHGITPTGTVEFKIGSTVMGSGSLDTSGVAVASFRLPPGTSKVTASYFGDSIFKASKSNSITFTTTPKYLVTLSTSVTYGPPNLSGAVKATIKVTVRGVPGNGAPTGSVTADSSFTCTALVPIGTSVNSSAKCTQRINSGVNEIVTVTYSGDLTYDGANIGVSVANGGGG